MNFSSLVLSSHLLSFHFLSNAIDYSVRYRYTPIMKQISHCVTSKTSDTTPQDSLILSLHSTTLFILHYKLLAATHSSSQTPPSTFQGETNKDFHRFDVDK